MSPCLDVLFLAVSLAGAASPLRVVSTLPTPGEIAREVGGDEVQVEVLAQGWSDPHSISPTPALMSRVREADLFLEIGLGLELWAERVIEGSGNPRIRPGQPGWCRVTDGLPRLEVPTRVDRSEGDLHPDGNPHMWLDPLYVRRMAEAVEAALARLRPEAAAGFAERRAAFQRRLDAGLFGEELVGLVGGDRLARAAWNGGLEGLLARPYKGAPLADRLGGWLARARALAGRTVIVYHKSWVYFAQRFGLEVVGTVEEKPGIPPSAAHRERLWALSRERGVRTIAYEAWYDARIPRLLAEETGALAVEVPLEIGGVPEATDYSTLLDTILARLAGDGGG
ncbi:MAG: zinc ABC transporter substrate-binding protein [Planctomycetes bacterium]|nr:zinc ABC transporter substrate-binding protein [Planctomycetota bacterium]